MARFLRFRLKEVRVKRNLLLVAFIFLLFVFSLHARVRDNLLSLGFDAGSLINLNASYHTGEYNSYEFYFAPNPEKWLLLGFGWKSHITNLFDFEPDINFYFGPEGYAYYIDHDHPMQFRQDGDLGLGIMILGSAGFSYYPDEVPIEFFGNIGAGLDTNPELDLVLKFAFGLRFSIAEIGN